MTISRKTVLIQLFLFMISFLLPLLAFAQGPTAAEYGVVLNLSGRQRMLSQKMSKEVLLINLKHSTQGNLENLQKTSELFDTTLKGLRDGDPAAGLPPTESRRILRQIDQKILPLWTEFHQTIQTILEDKAVSPEQLATIASTNLPLLAEMNKCVKLYEKDAAKAGLKSAPGLAVMINLAGKQRMLTQKMSKEFLLIASQYEVETNKLNLQETSALFERTLKGLKDGDSTLDLPGTEDEGIRVQLEQIEALWKAFKPNIEFALGSDGNIPEEKITSLAEQNLPLLKEMNKAVKMYELQATKQ